MYNHPGMLWSAEQANQAVRDGFRPLMMDPSRAQQGQYNPIDVANASGAALPSNVQQGAMMQRGGSFVPSGPPQQMQYVMHGGQPQALLQAFPAAAQATALDSVDAQGRRGRWVPNEGNVNEGPMRANSNYEDPSRHDPSKQGAQLPQHMQQLSQVRYPQARDGMDNGGPMLGKVASAYPAEQAYNAYPVARPQYVSSGWTQLPTGEAITARVPYGTEIATGLPFGTPAQPWMQSGVNIMADPSMQAAGKFAAVYRPAVGGVVPDQAAVLPRKGKKKPHACPHCNAVLQGRSTLLRHMLIHTGEKPFECTTCHRRFRQKGTMKNHMKTHSRRNKTYNCRMCSAEFRQLVTLERHEAKMHGAVHSQPNGAVAATAPPAEASAPSAPGTSSNAASGTVAAAAGTAAAASTAATSGVGSLSSRSGSSDSANPEINLPLLPKGQDDMNALSPSSALLLSPDAA